MKVVPEYPDLTAGKKKKMFPAQPSPPQVLGPTPELTAETQHHSTKY